MGIEKIVEGFRKLKVLVIGDFFLDKYYIYDPKIGEPSLETGIIPIVVTEYEPSPGAAGNVAKNVAMLGARATALGVIGDDEEGRTLLECLERLGVDTSHMIVSPHRATQFYSKFFNAETMKEDKPRIDRYDFSPLTEDEERELKNKLDLLVKEADVVLLIDQCEAGKFRTLNHGVVDHLRSLKRKYPGKLFIADSRKNVREFLDFCVVKCNTIELLKAAGEILKESVEKCTNPILCSQIYGKKFFERFGNPIAITLGEKGALGIDEGGTLIRISAKEAEVVDVCGAGDAFTSCFSLALIESQDFRKALSFGVNCGGICVQQPRTGKVTPKVLLNEFEALPPFSLKNENTIVLNPEKIKNERVKVALFDFDGTVSLLRQGWEDVMEEVMMEAITGGKEISEELYHQILSTVRNLINRSTGVRTSVQMRVLEKLVRRYGLTPEKEILSYQEYKKIYTSRLKEVVKKRMNEVNTGRKKKEEFLVKGVIEFLELLKENSIKVFLASGTDRSDVVEEAKFLGVYDYFEPLENVVNVKGEITKRKIVEELVKRFDLSGGELLIVGDGPVEIMIGWKYKALTLGVACDEYEEDRWDFRKVERLSRAKADILIPNFSLCLEDLKSLIF